MARLTPHVLVFSVWSQFGFSSEEKMIHPKKKTTASGFDLELGGLSRLRVALKTDRKLDKGLVVLAIRPLDVLVENLGALHHEIVGNVPRGLTSLKKRAGGLVRKRDNGFESDIGMVSKLRTAIRIDTSLTRALVDKAVSSIDELTDALLTLHESVLARKSAVASVQRKTA
jgi:hypothetical protein